MLEGLRLGFATKSLAGSRGTVDPDGDRGALGVVFRLSNFLLDTDEAIVLLIAQSRIEGSSSPGLEFWSSGTRSPPTSGVRSPSLNMVSTEAPIERDGEAIANSRVHFGDARCWRLMLRLRGVVSWQMPWYTNRGAVSELVICIEPGDSDIAASYAWAT
jgi:hypothetical protein